MPGILGLVTKQTENNQELFSRMLDSVNHFSYKIDSTFNKNICFGRVHLNYVNNKIDFARSNDGRFLLTLSGEIFSYKNTETSQIEDDQTFLLDIFIKDGIDCLKWINGHFCAAIYDFVEEKLYLISDRMGTRPHYYANTSDGFIFAPEVKAILKSEINKELDYLALSEMFNFGHLFGNKTLFKEISQLPPASYLLLCKESQSIHKYWDFPEYADAYKKIWPSKSSIKQTTDEFINIFTNSMRRNFAKNKNKILISLSGGLDSRYVAAYAKQFEVKPLVSFTMGPKGSEDQMYSKLVTEKIGMQHNPFEVKPQNIWKDAERFSYFSDYMYMIQGPIQGFEAIESFSGDKQVTVSSQMCDALFGSTLVRKRFKVLIDKKTFDDEAKGILTECFRIFDDSLLKRIFTNDFYNKINDKYKDIPQQYINSNSIPIHAYLNLLIHEHVRRGTLSGNFMNNLYMETRMPSFDNDVIDFAYKLPLKLREHQYLYRRAFTQLFPDLAKIKRQHFNISIDASNTRYRLSIIETKIVTILKKSRLEPLINRIPKYNRPSYTNYNSWFKNELYDDMVSIVLDKRTLSRGIYNEEGLRSIVNSHKNTKNDHSRLLWQIINLEYFFRNNID